MNAPSGDGARAPPSPTISSVFTGVSKWLCAGDSIVPVLLLAVPVVLVFTFIALQILGCTAACSSQHLSPRGFGDQPSGRWDHPIGGWSQASLELLAHPALRPCRSSILRCDRIAVLNGDLTCLRRIVRLTGLVFIRDGVIAAAVMSLGLLLLRSLPPLPLAGIGAALYFAILFALKTITWQEIWQFKRAK